MKIWIGRIIVLSKKRRLAALIALIALLSGISAIVFASVRKSPADSSMKEGHVVKMAEAKPCGQAKRSSYPGTVRAYAKANLFFRVGGPVVAIDFQIGDKVRKGQILMRIDPRDFERKVESLKHQVEQEEARFAAMKNGDRPEDKEIANKELAAATARFEKAQFDYKRAEKLHKSDVYSKAQYDEAKSAFLVAESDFAANKQRLAKSHLGSRQEDIDAEAANLKALRTQLKIAEDALSDTVLSAPFDGIITKRFLDSHEMAQAYAPALTVQDITTVKIDVDVPETNLAALDALREKTFSVYFNSRPGLSCKAQLKEFDTDANAATRTYTLTMHMRQPADFSVLPGMTAEVEGDYLSGANPQADGGVVIPSAAVVRKPGADKDIVWLLDASGKAVKSREVKVAGAAGPDCVIVADGMKAGEMVVAAGGSFLEEGMTVRQLDFHKGVDVK